MLELEVSPGQCLGTSRWEFILGMHFSQAVAILQQQASSIRGIQVIYNQASPLVSDLVLYLSQDGIKLVFDPMSQRLKLIHIVNMKLVRLTYCNRIFNAPDTLPTRLRIDEAFGATHPEDFCEQEQQYILTFPGLAFHFPSEARAGLTGGQQLLVASLQIYYGKRVESARVPSLPPSPGQLSLDTLTVIRDHSTTRGVKLTIILDAGGRGTSETQLLTRSVMFGDSCQTVLSTIGAPNRVFYKSEDKMKIHNTKRQKGIRHSDYFFNYFTLGLDVLFDAKCHRVKKFVLHTNFPGHHNFNMYQRCNFELPLTLKCLPPSTKEAAQLIDLPEVVTVGPESKWSNIGRRLCTRGPPVVLRKTCSSGGGGGAGGNIAPTSSVQLTYCYNHQDIIVEVMANDHIAAVTLFMSPAEAS
uniref:UPF0183 protein CG7083 n=1 Tax=Hirondellea gigas TaxID=1518452 RepID=A0A2P2I9G3_9CRUS